MFPVDVGTHSGPVVRPVVLVLVGIVCVLPLCFVFGCMELGLTYMFHSDSVPCETHSNSVQFGVHFLVQVDSFVTPASLWGKSDCRLAVSPGCMTAAEFVCSLAGYSDSILELVGMWLAVVPCQYQTPSVVGFQLHSSCSSWTVTD